MKKKLLLICFIILIALQAVPSFAEEGIPMYVFDFSDKEFVNSLTVWRNTVRTFNESDQVLSFSAQNGVADPGVALPVEDPFDAADALYMKIRFQTEVSNACMEFFFMTEEMTSFDADHYFNFDYTPSEEWQDAVYKIEASSWTGVIESIRFDYFQGNSGYAADADGTEFQCAYIAFFNTAEEADNFMKEPAEQTTEPTAAATETPKPTQAANTATPAPSAAKSAASATGKTSSEDSKLSGGMIALIIGGGVVLVGGISVLTVYLIKKKNS